MRRTIFFVLSACIALLSARLQAESERGYHLWIPTEGGYVELDTYDPGNCVWWPGTYCTYLTTVNFINKQMSDSLFHYYDSVGVFKGQTPNYRYINY